jgi:hypothetical protein
MCSPLRKSGRTKTIVRYKNEKPYKAIVSILCADVKVLSHPSFKIVHKQCSGQNDINLVARVDTKYKKNELVSTIYTFTEEVLLKLKQSSQLVG